MSVLILAEHDGQHIRQSTRSSINAAQARNEPVHLLLCSDHADTLAHEAQHIKGVDLVLHASAKHFAHPLAEDIASLIMKLGNDYTAILAAHTPFTRNILPRAAALLDVGMISDVIEIISPNTYVRSIYAGNILVTVKSSDTLQMFTIRTSAFKPAENQERAAPVQSVSAPDPFKRTRFIDEVHHVSDRPDLSSAKIIVSGGRPLGDQFEALLTPLAKKMNAAIGATRAAVDAGFAPNEWQVGSTGCIVAPQLYIAIGISGAVQHLAGMKDSQVIVAINHDPDAPIFKVADYGLVADLFEVLPELTDALN
ncbi:MAG: FAD-binding protein [Proteobacteria bacterium]|nr:FAD-binding protein [Pseudomonadota bacterium]MDE3207406.1 FAD-binding protein [Pseudomonadota bacterium]